MKLGRDEEAEQLLRNACSSRNLDPEKVSVADGGAKEIKARLLAVLRASSVLGHMLLTRDGPAGKAAKRKKEGAQLLNEAHAQQKAVLGADHVETKRTAARLLQSLVRSPLRAWPARRPSLPVARVPLAPVRAAQTGGGGGMCAVRACAALAAPA